MDVFVVKPIRKVAKFQELAERIRFHNGSVSLVAKLRIDLRDGGADTFRFSCGGSLFVDRDVEIKYTVVGMSCSF